ncbi:MAG TPA: serine/threonine-protein kinase, partial [Methanoregulaceae archaeon]|nr:serine/threonine-protein kinase [Methanoregulaceae archaeon]
AWAILLIFLLSGFTVILASAANAQTPPRTPVPVGQQVADLRDRVMDTLFLTVIYLVVFGICALAIQIPVVLLDIRKPKWKSKAINRPLRYFFIFSHAVLAIVLFLLASVMVNLALFRGGASPSGVISAAIAGFPLVFLCVSSIGMSYAIFEDWKIHRFERLHLAFGLATLFLYLVLAYVTRDLPFILWIPLAIFISLVLLLLHAHLQNTGMKELQQEAKRTILETDDSKDIRTEFPSELKERYYDTRFLSRGGVARVYSARRRKDGEYVAVKIPIRDDELTGRSMLREMSVWEGLDHPAIVKVSAVNILPVPYVEMEYIPGSLDEIPKPMGIPHAVSLICQVASGLSYAHSRGVIHRDLKPANILLSREGMPKISDWGLSKGEYSRDSSTVYGFSLAYVAPEQLDPDRFGPTGPSTDIYQIGTILYELVCGRLPFEGTGYEEVVGAKLKNIPPLPSEINPDARAIESVIMKCLEREPAQRYVDVNAFIDDLCIAPSSHKISR